MANGQAEANHQKYKYPTVEAMYGADDLGNDPIFPGGYINYGYWKDIALTGQLITLENRIQSQANLYKTIFERAQITKDDAVLEAGCGRGQGLRLLCDTIGPEMAYGIDFSSYQVRRSLHTLEGTRGNVCVIQSPAESLPFDEGSFTKVYSVEAIQHFKSPEAFIHELGRVVRENGLVTLTSFFAKNKTVIPELIKMFPTIKRGVDNPIDINDVVKWLQESGFGNIEVNSIGDNVWERFVEWCNQAKPDEVSTNWLDAYQRGLLDYYTIVATKQTS